jgi:hypothetical protein
VDWKGREGLSIVRSQMLGSMIVGLYVIKEIACGAGRDWKRSWFVMRERRGVCASSRFYI